jgi:nitrile hydratase subunit alpha
MSMADRRYREVTSRPKPWQRVEAARGRSQTPCPATRLGYTRPVPSHHPEQRPGHGHDEAHSHLSEMDLRVRALETVLREKGYIDPVALDLLIETYEKKIGPHNGARVVARAWVDEDFKQRLLTEATAAIASLGYAGRQGEYMVVLENTPKLHNMVVCTLCSCYPWPVLGLPPVWYKSGPYRSRAVMAPRDVLRDFGVELPADTEIRLWDSTAEVRYLVLPMRPPGTEGWSEERLASIVTRDCMIGTGLPRLPDEAAA